MPKALDQLKDVTYTQQSMVNNLEKSPDAESKRALSILKPQYEKSLSLYDAALKKYKQK